MTRILPRHKDSGFLTLQMCFIYRIAQAFFLLCFVTNILANEVGRTECIPQEFKKTYFLLNTDEVADAAMYFKQVFENFFENIEPFTSSVGTRIRVEKYFDTEQLSILNENSGLSMETDEHLPLYRAGRKRILYKDYNTQKNYVFEVKRYNKKISPLDKHPLFGEIKRGDRPLLLNILQEIENFSVGRLVESLHVDHEDLVFLISHFGVPSAEVTMNKFHISNYGLPNTFTVLKFELLPDAQSHLTSDESNLLGARFCQAINAFQDKFPQIEPLGSFGYNNYIQIADELLPGRHFFRNNPLIFKLGQIMIFSLVGFLILYLLIGRYTRRNIFRNLHVDIDLKRHDN